MRITTTVLAQRIACAATLGAGALCTPAQAQSSVQLYGIVDTGVARVNNGRTAATTVVSGGQNASRWGFRGTEDLGGGLSAYFNLEAQMSTDDGSLPAPNVGFQRRAVVGFRSTSWGEFSMGREYTPSYWALIENDITRFGLFGTLQAINSLGVATPRVSRAVSYATPSWNGFTLRVQHAFGDTSTATRDVGKSEGVGLRYAADRLTLNLAYVTLRVAPPATPAGLPSTITRQLAAGGGYDFGDFRFTVGGGYSDPAQPSAKVTFAHLGGAYVFGPSQIFAQWVHFKTEVANGRANSLALSYTYNLSKRTNFYASMGRTANNSTGSFPLNISQTSFAPGAAGADVRGVMAGIRHLF
jgi:predicted porin